MNELYTSIHDIVGDYLIERLNEALIINSPDPILTPTDVGYGNLQDNPAKRRISVRVHQRDPDQQSDTVTDWTDMPAHMTTEWKEWPSNEIGTSGETFWSRRFVVEILVYLTRSKEDRLDARMVHNYVASAAKTAIDCVGCVAIDRVDNFGERLLMVKAARYQNVEGGGPPGNFNYRSKIYVSALTEKE